MPRARRARRRDVEERELSPVDVMLNELYAEVAAAHPLPPPGKEALRMRALRDRVRLTNAEAAELARLEKAEADELAALYEEMAQWGPGEPFEPGDDSTRCSCSSVHCNPPRVDPAPATPEPTSPAQLTVVRTYL